MKKFEWYLEWGSTSILVVGVFLQAFNVYPLGAWISLIGNFGWFIVALSWRKWSLVSIQIIISLIYILGLAHHSGNALL